MPNLTAAAYAAILDPERKVVMTVFEHLEAYQVVIDNRRNKQPKDNHAAAIAEAVRRVNDGQK